MSVSSTKKKSKLDSDSGEFQREQLTQRGIIKPDTNTEVKNVVPQVPTLKLSKPTVKVSTTTPKTQKMAPWYSTALMLARNAGGKQNLYTEDPVLIGKATKDYLGDADTYDNTGNDNSYLRARAEAKLGRKSTEADKKTLIDNYLKKHPEYSSKKKYKMKVDNSLGESFGEMNPDTNEIKINLKAHHKKGKLDVAELASTIKHEMMHVEKPHATEKEVYKATAKTKISPAEQMALVSKLKRKSINYKSGALKRKFKMGRVDTKPGDFINQMNKNKIKRKINNNQSIPRKEMISIMGLI
jgi:hypothetical protein